MSTSNDSNLKQLELPFTVTIELTRGKTTTIDAIDADLAELRWWAAHMEGNHYASRSIWVNKKRRNVQLHRIVLSRMLGRELVKGECVDHINCNSLDNRRCNLRLATRTENNRNQRISSNNTSGYKGVSWDKVNRKWLAQITVNHKGKKLGRFATPEEAYEAYCNAAKEYFGEFARLE